MRTLTHAVFLFALAATAANAQETQGAARQDGAAVAQTLTSIPSSDNTISRWYKQNVYDPSDNKIGQIMDVLMDREGKAVALVIGVGGFLGMGEKDVAVPFNSVRVSSKDDNKFYLVMNATKDSLKSAKGFRYDRNTMAWVPEETPATTGGPASPPLPRPGANR
jgi:sporulation protein YlmC with PRC-barrel domain